MHGGRKDDELHDGSSNECCTHHVLSNESGVASERVSTLFFGLPLPRHFGEARSQPGHRRVRVRVWSWCLQGQRVIPSGGRPPPGVLPGGLDRGESASFGRADSQPLQTPSPAQKNCDEQCDSISTEEPFVSVAVSSTRRCRRPRVQPQVQFIDKVCFSEAQAFDLVHSIMMDLKKKASAVFFDGSGESLLFDTSLLTSDSNFGKLTLPRRLHR